MTVKNSVFFIFLSATLATTAHAQASKTELVIESTRLVTLPNQESNPSIGKSIFYSGDIIYKIPIGWQHSATPKDSIAIKLGGATWTINPGAILHSSKITEGSMVGLGPSPVFFCSTYGDSETDLSSFPISGVASEGNRARSIGSICLVDLDKNGDFDHVFVPEAKDILHRSLLEIPHTVYAEYQDRPIEGMYLVIKPEKKGIISSSLSLIMGIIFRNKRNAVNYIEIEDKSFNTYNKGDISFILHDQDKDKYVDFGTVKFYIDSSDKKGGLVKIGRDAIFNSTKIDFGTVAREVRFIQI